MGNRQKRRKRIKVGFIGPTLYFGGAEMWMLNLVKHCNPLKIEWTCNVIAYPALDNGMLGIMSEEIKTYATHSLHHKGEVMDCSLEEAIDLLIRESDIIVGWELDKELSGKIGDGNKKLINVLHRADPGLRETILEEHRIAAVTSSCLEVANISSDKKPKIIHCGIDIHRTKPTMSRVDMRQRWQLANDNLIIGYVGRIARDKNSTAIGKAVMGLGSNAFGVIYGSQNEDSAKIINEIRKYSDNRVKIYPPAVGAEIGNVFVGIDVFLLPSLSEAGPLVIMEAFAAGVPCVITKNNIFQDRLEEKYGQLSIRVSPLATPDEFAEAINAARTLPAEVINRAKKVVQAEFDIKRMCHEWEDYIYESFEAQDSLTKS